MISLGIISLIFFIALYASKSKIDLDRTQRRYSTAA